ncbi:MAG TPA: hypothetical protein PKY10_06435 [Lentisphaeria bacterium]|nr:hypothetical protein [Lentisphaeria bacterium]
MRRLTIILTLISLLGIIRLGADDEASLVRSLLQAEEQATGVEMDLTSALTALEAPTPRVQLAALRMIIAAGQENQAAVEPLLRLLQKPLTSTPAREVYGYAVAALVTVCRDEDVFAQLLATAEPAQKMTLSNALLDSEAMTPRLAALLEWPEPDFAPSVDSILVNSGFEDGLAGWKLTLHDGAEGSMDIDSAVVRSGHSALVIHKTNGRGYLELRAENPLEIPAGETWTWRGFYHADDAPASALLLFRLEDEQGVISAHDNVPRGGWGWQSQSFLLNAPPDQWQKRILTLRAAETTRRMRPVIQIYGNPLTVRLDDLTFPSPAWRFPASMPVPEPPRYALAEIEALYAGLTPSTARLVKTPTGLTGIEVDGEVLPPALHFPYQSRLGDFHLFNQNGVRIHNVLLPIDNLSGPMASSLSRCTSATVWPSAAQKPDYTAMLGTFKQALRREPDAYIILGFNLHWPADYVQLNPETRWSDEHGLWAKGNVLYMSGFARLEDLKPGETLWPSPYLDKPFADAAEVICGFVAELKKTGLDKRIIGTFVCGGHDGQFEVRHHDHSPAGAETWRQWLRQRYRDDAGLRQAWNDPTATLETAAVPVQKYHLYPDQTSPVFYSPALEAASRDYESYREERIWLIKNMLVSAVKKAFAKPMLGITWQMGDFIGKDSSALWSQADALDIVVTQYAYQHRRPGMPHGFSVPFASFKTHQKMWVSELDLRSWLRETYNNELGSMKIGTPLSLAEFQSVHRKLLAPQLASGGAGWWYYDISHNAFSHPQIQQEIQQTTTLFTELSRRENHFRPEVAVVTDAATVVDQRIAIHRFRCPVTWLTQYQQYALGHSGVPYDMWLLDDLMQSPQAENYKVYVFLNSFALTEPQRAFIERLKSGQRTLIFNYAPGYLDHDAHAYDLNRLSALVGMAVETSFQPRAFRAEAESGLGLLPLQGFGDVFRSQHALSLEQPFLHVQRFAIVDPSAERLARYTEDGATAIARKDFGEWVSLYVAPPAGLSPELLHAASQKAGAFTVCAPNWAHVAVSDHFLSVYALRNGTCDFTLPRSVATIRDAFTGEQVGAGKSLTLTLSAGQTRWFRLE